MTFKKFLFLCVFAIPFLPQGVGFYLGPNIPTIDLPRILMAILIVAWFVNKAVRGEPFRFFHNKISTLLLFLIFIQFLSIFITENQWLSFSQWVGYLLYYYFIFFILSDQLENDNDCYTVMKYILILTFLMALVSVIEFILGKGLYDNWRTGWSANPEANFMAVIWRQEGINASKGPYGTTQPFGFFFALTFFLTLYFFYVNKDKWSRLSNFIIMLLSAMAILATQVRSAILAVGFTLVLSFVRKKAFFYYIKNFFIIGLIITVIFILVIKYLPPDFLKFTFYDSLFKVAHNEGSYFKRLNGLADTMDQLWLRPFLGYGAGAVVKHMSLQTDFQLVSDLPLSIAYFAESGIFAFMAITLIQFYSLLLLYRQYIKETIKQKKELLFYLFLGFLAYYIALLGAPHLESSFTYFALLAVVCYLTGSKKRCVSVV